MMGLAMLGYLRENGKGAWQDFLLFLQRRGYSHVDIISMMQGTNVGPLSLDVAAANEQASVPR